MSRLVARTIAVTALFVGLPWVASALGYWLTGVQG